MLNLQKVNLQQRCPDVILDTAYNRNSLSCHIRKHSNIEIQDSSDNRVKVGVNSLKKVCVMLFPIKTSKAPL